jgi:Na+-transporting NADH:ubiquinone oxidoreductase subunit C
MALEGDGNTVAGLGFYEHAELQVWVVKLTIQIGKLNGLVSRSIKVMKWTSVGERWSDRSDRYGVDALSGATLTSRGVDNLLKFWMSDAGFKPFLDNLKQGRI